LNWTFALEGRTTVMVPPTPVTFVTATCTANDVTVEVAERIFASSAAGSSACAGIGAAARPALKTASENKARMPAASAFQEAKPAFHEERRDAEARAR
jgi:hypothetical protein